MRIRIIDTSLCDTCGKKSCSSMDVIERNTFTKFRSERYTCPLRLFQYGPTDKQLDEGYIDVPVAKDELGCVYCCLCAVHCSKDNLKIEGYSLVDSHFSDIMTKVEKQNGGCCNILALSYLHTLFDFAANTNINKAMSFDGFMCDNNDNWYFVEVDSSDDSLESCRRLLGDIVLQNHKGQKKVSAGIMVLNNLPKAGSRDVYTSVEGVHKFPKTRHIKIYATTFSLLRYFANSFKKNEKSVNDLLFNMTEETPETYAKRLVETNIIPEDAIHYLF